MSRYLDKLPLVDGLYLAKKYLIKWQNHQERGNGNEAIIFRSTLTGNPNSSPKLIARNQENLWIQNEIADKPWMKPN